jgi:acyl-CoA thioesterase I
MKVVCIGNSIVKGFPHRQGQSFPSLIRETTGWQVINKGVNGDTTAMVLNRFQKDAVSHHPDRVIILTGANDFIYETASPKEAMGNITKMVELASAHNIETILLTPLLCEPDQASREWMAAAAVDYYAVNRKLEELGELIRQTSDAKGCTVVDLGLKYKGFGKYHDGLHPTVEGQEWIAHCIISETVGENKNASRK